MRSPALRLARVHLDAEITPRVRRGCLAAERIDFRRWPGALADRCEAAGSGEGAAGGG